MTVRIRRYTGSAASCAIDLTVQLFELLLTGQHRLVTLFADEAEEAERAVRGGVELMPRQRIDGHEVTLIDRLHIGSDAYRAAAAQDQYRMRVLVLFER